MNNNINQRAQHLLRILIRRYIEDGRPISSRKLAEDSEISLSSASVRNVMADLEELGYLHSPHTSAGRIPTPTAYRFFANGLLTARPMDDALFEQYHKYFDPDEDKHRLLQSASNLMSSICKMVSIVTIPQIGQLILRHVEFLLLSNNRVLVILVVNEKEVQNRIIHTERKFSQRELENVGNYLSDMFTGKDLVMVRNELIAGLRNDQENLDELMKNVIELSDKAFIEPKQQQDYFITGETHLLDYETGNDIERLKKLFQAFTQKQEILGILNSCLNAEGIQIFIGDESEHHALDNCSVITAPYTADGQTVGVLGIIGPSRMPYDEVIPLVDVTAKLLSSALN